MNVRTARWYRWPRAERLHVGVRGSTRLGLKPSTLCGLVLPPSAVLVGAGALCRRCLGRLHRTHAGAFAARRPR